MKMPVSRRCGRRAQAELSRRLSPLPRSLLLARLHSTQLCKISAQPTSDFGLLPPGRKGHSHILTVS